MRTKVLRLLSRGFTGGALLLAVVASVASAADGSVLEKVAGSGFARTAAVDLTGTWHCCGGGGAAAQDFVITSGKGSLKGRAELPGGQVFAAITGSVSGNKVRIVTTYNSFAPGYVAPFVGTLSADGNTITGTWTSNRNQAGTFTATREVKKKASTAVAKVVDIKAVGPGPAKAQYYRDGRWRPLTSGLGLEIGDGIRTNGNSTVAFELAIGGRITVIPSSEVKIVDERRVNVVRAPTVKLVKGGMWGKAKDLKGPIEIQTNGGVMGIKG